MLGRKVFRRVVNYYEKANLDKLLNTSMVDDIDARALYNFSFKELKKNVSAEVWAQIVKDNPFYDIPEFYEINDFEDIIPHFHHTLPPYLSKPAVVLSELQRAAKKMTLDYIKNETDLIKKRAKALSEFPIVSKDNYEIEAGLMVVRDPIWLLYDEKEMKWLSYRTKVLSEHSKLASIKASDFLYLREPVSGEDNRSIRMRNVLKKFESNEDLSYTPYEKPSTHWLEADPNEPDPRSISYAGGYRVWLLLKERKTNKWVFPKVKMFGTHTFSDAIGRIKNELLEGRLKLETMGPLACKVDVQDKDKQVDRPRFLSEDIYDLYFKRSKILFPDSSDETIARYLKRRYNMEKNQNPQRLELKGKKTFFFRALYQDGNFGLMQDSEYDDWAWVPKLELSKYLDEDQYTRFVKVLSLT